MIGVSAKNPSATDESFTAAATVAFAQVGSSSFEECKSLLLKILSSPSEAKGAPTEDDSFGGLPPQSLNEAMEGSAPVCSSEDGKGKMLAAKSTVSLPNDTNGSKNEDKLLKRAWSSTSQMKRRSARLGKFSGSICRAW